MSTQNILELSRERYLQESEERLLQLSDAYFYKNKFLVGEGVNRDELSFTMQSNKLLATDNCEMISFIADKIAGKLEKKLDRADPKKKFAEALRLAQQYLQMEGGTLDEAVSDCCGWSEAEW